MDGLDDVDLAGALPYALPLVDRFRGTTVREGVLLRGPVGWGDFCPFPEYGDDEAADWLAAAVEAATRPWPAPVRDLVPVNVTVPAVAPARAREIVAGSGCTTAKVKVAEHPASGAEDEARLEAVRDALGPAGLVRIDANGRWDLETACARLPALDRAAGGLDYVEQPCASLTDLAAVRRRTGTRVAADESIRRAGDPLRVALAGAADVAVIKATPLGGVRRALAVAEAAGLPCVVSSALESGVGLAAEVAFAGALPQLAGACGLRTAALLAGDVVPATSPASRTAVPGHVAVAARSPEPDPGLLDRWRQRDPDRRRWWDGRLLRAAAALQARGGRG
ncbi:MAG: o-succinylbenzoate synthase [Kineosporiaceae bacterium]